MRLTNINLTPEFLEARTNHLTELVDGAFENGDLAADAYGDMLHILNALKPVDDDKKLFSGIWPTRLVALSGQ